MEPLISVIVPVYNVEPYLRKCVDSILNQTYRNLEVILVDDGSPDNCGTICDEYAARDDRVKVIHKTNGGLSDARNAGFRVMSGEYLIFVDSDDVLPERAAEALLDTARAANADLVIGEHLRFESDLPEESVVTTPVRTMTGIEAMGEFFRGGCASWARLYRKEVHDSILFPVGEINEDEAIVLHILERCSCVAHTNEIVYFYRCRPESITTMAFSPKKLVWVKHCKDNLAFVQEKYPELEPDAAARYRGSLLWALTEMACESEYDAEARALLTELKANKALLRKAPYSYRTDRLRLLALLYLPYSLYRIIIRKRRKSLEI